jgi:hypothetical protein
MAKLALNTGAENVVRLYASLLQLTIIQTMTIPHSGHAQYAAANYLVQTQVCCGASGERSCRIHVGEVDRIAVLMAHLLTLPRGEFLSFQMKVY